MVALVDADSLLYKVGFAIEEKVVWNEMELEAGLETEPLVAYYTDAVKCRLLFDQLVDNIKFATETDDVLLVFTGGNNFRMDLPISYKDNRKDSRKPLEFDLLLTYAHNHYNTHTCEYFEADDYVVYLKHKHPEDYVLCAIDKDVLYQTEGTHYNYGNDREVTTTDEEGIKYAYFQTLMGDTVDGYKGCPGIGKVKAEKLLKDCTTESEMWAVVVGAYESKGLTEEDALWTMRIANMRQLGDDGKITYWNPPKAGA